MTELVLDGGVEPLAEQPLELLGEVPVLGAEDLLDALVEELRDGAARGRRTTASTSAEAFSNSARTKSVCDAACSRASTRAPITTASISTLAGSSPASIARAHELDRPVVGDHQPVDDDGVGEDGDAGEAEGCGGFHGEDVTP